MKKTVLTLLQVLITIAVLFFVFRDPRKRAEMGNALHHAQHWWLLAGIAAYGVVELLAGLRWRKLLEVQGIDLSWIRIFMLLLIGVFFNFFIPGGTGGDVVKIFYLLKEVGPGKRTAALLSVLVDRIIGLLSLILLAAVFIATRWSWLTATPDTTKFVWSALIVLGVSTGAVVFSFALSGFGLVHRLPARFPGRDKLAELALAHNLYGRAWKAALYAMMISLLVHLGYIATFYCAGKAFEAARTKVPTFIEMCAVMPLVNTIASLPISVGGVGVREGLFQVFLHQLAGIHEAVAVLISSTGFLLTAVWGAIGGVLYILYRPSEHARLTAITEQVAAIEHDVAETEIALESGEETETEEAKR